MVRRSTPAAAAALAVLLLAGAPAAAQDAGKKPPAPASPPKDADPPLSPEEAKKHEAAVKALVEQLRAEKNKERMLERITLLGTQGGRVNRDALMAFARGNKNHEFVGSAFQALGKIGGSAVVDFLCAGDALRAYNQFLVQVAAAKALGEMGDARAADALLEVIQGARSKIEVVSAACQAAARVAPRDARVAAEVLKQSRAKDDTVRANAVEAVGRLGSDAAFERLVEAIEKDGNTRVRGAAATGLKHLGRKEAVPHLRKAAEGDKSETVKALANEALTALAGAGK